MNPQIPSPLLHANVFAIDLDNRESVRRYLAFVEELFLAGASVMNLHDECIITYPDEPGRREEITAIIVKHEMMKAGTVPIDGRAAMNAEPDLMREPWDSDEDNHGR